MAIIRRPIVALLQEVDDRAERSGKAFRSGVEQTISTAKCEVTGHRANMSGSVTPAPALQENG